MIKTSFQLFLLMKIEFSLVNIDQIMRAPYGGVFVQELILKNRSVKPVLMRFKRKNDKML